ncbi:DUF6344 domain-containing protein [Actinacidiphila rubida]|uniref:Secreted protein n=1 Tax=Actinacidiphila rubida TaxID=310780 RepID=A0A1H8GE75_9ACTN|nr:DUF6344 domain-containing protein [Actinacidiphila rubida]SEN42075.1 hypothetical protein SAMN05216267_100539 [Actinacidiphila rubida]
MAATATVKTFWGALLSVLLKCIAALGFTTAATRTRTTTAARSGETAGAACGTTATTAAVPAAGGAGSPGDGPTAAAHDEREVWRVPSPRAYEPLRETRDRVLPPTMRQRITAEAHGATPAGRSLPAGTLLTDDGYGGLMTVPATAANTARAARSTAGASGTADSASGTAARTLETAGLRA